MKRDAGTGFLRDESGGVSIFSLFALSASLMLAGLAVDGANGWRMKNRLQIASDAAALAAAAKLPDQAAARNLALVVAQKNLGSDSIAIGAQDVSFGDLDESGTFVEGAGGNRAVQVRADMSRVRGNPLATHFLKLVGIDSLEPGAASVAMGAGPAGSGAALGCEDAMVLTQSNLDTGGGNTLDGRICLHGRTGLHTGGNDYFAGGVQLSAENVSRVTVNHTRAGSATRDEVARASDLSPVVLPKLAQMFEQYWSAIAIPGANGRDLQIDGWYSGDLLPDFLKDAQGRIAVIHVDQGWWTVQPGQLRPNTVYLVNHGMQIAGNVQAQKVAIIARGQIGVGGGPNLHYTDDFFFATGAINTGGDIQWGDPGRYCETGRYSVYTFSVNEMVSLGGWGGGAGAHGLFGAAPSFNPGGAMRNSGGLYFEARNFVALGGNLQIKGCGQRLEGHYEQALPVQEAVRSTGARLTR